MRLNRFDLNLLVALDALLRDRSVTHAAERMFVSQPAMSAALAKLREYFADPLLVRVGRDLELTPRGRSLVEPVKQALLQAQAVLGSQLVFDPAAERRTFTVLSPEHLTPWVIPAVLRRLDTLAPGIRLQIERPTIAGLARLTQGNLDLMLAIDGTDLLPLPLLSESLCYSFVATIRYLAVVAVHNTQVREVLTRDQFLDLPHVVVRSFGLLSLEEKTAQDAYGRSLDVRVATENVLEVPYLVTGTSLVGIVSEPLAKPLRDSPRLRVVELESGVMPDSRLDLVWHRAYQSDAAHAWLRGVILEEVSAP